MYTIIHRNSRDKGYEFKDRIVEKVKTYFEELLKAIKDNDEVRLRLLSRHIHEAQYTSLGYSQEGPGKGFGTNKFAKLVSSIKKSEAFETGLISDVLDVELYIEQIGVDIISDLVTNLIQDVLSEYTENVANELAMADKLRNVNTHFWDEEKRKWIKSDLQMISYTKELGDKEYNYLLVPEGFTCDENQKDKILKQIFDDSVYEIYTKKILSDREKYGQYIYETKSRIGVYKKQVSKLINEEFGEGSAVEGRGYLTPKGLLDLIKNYKEIKDFIELEIKNKV
ncbi:hypothetical protein P5F16_06930 [Clostridium perfringens]|nr:hypothetical protein [Clostridium perfringens]